MTHPILRNRDFDLYWSGVVFSQIGARGTVAANLYHVYALTDSVAQTGLVGAAQAIALLVLSPMGGVYADRLDRRRLLQSAQALALVAAAALAAVTLAGAARPWHILVTALVTTAAATFDQPARQALIPVLVPREQLPAAFALLNPSREVAVLIGPALAGILIAVGGPGLMYLVDAVTYAVLIAGLALIRVPPLRVSRERRSFRSELREGARHVARRRVIWTLITLDLSATLFSAYRVLLPALALDVLDVGPTGYGMLAAGPSAGALLATYFIFRLVNRSDRLGRVVIVATTLYGLSAVLLASSSAFALSVVAAGLLGVFDATSTSIRHAAVQLETPDELRGRVSSLYGMASRGGPALGDVLVGAVAGVVGPVAALAAGGLVTSSYACSFLVRPNVVRSYRRTPDAELASP